MKKARLQVGALSVRLRLSVPMLLKGAAFRLMGHAGSPFLPAGGAVTLLKTLIRSMTDPQYGLEVDSAEGIPFIRSEQVYLFPPSPMLDPWSWCRAGWRAFTEYVRKYGKPDLIHCHNCVSAGMLGRTISRKTGIPYLITEHSSYFDRDLYPRPVLSMARRALESSRRNLAVSQTLASAVRKKTRLPETAAISVFPNVLAPEFEKEIPRPAQVAEQPFTFLMVCILEGNKRVDLALSAMAKTVYPQTNLRLRIVGEGPLRESLVAQAKDLGLANRVFFAGKKSSVEVREEMLGANGLLLCSDVETFGVVLIEAMACGRPVIATRCGGPESIVTPEAGLLVPRDDATALAQAMVEMVRRRHEFQSDTIRNLALERYGSSAVAEALRRIYEEILHAG